MCGIFGIISSRDVNSKDLSILADKARQRGKDSSGFLEYDGFKYIISRYDYDLKKSIKKTNKKSKIIIGHSRLVTNSMSDNQPIHKNNITILHNGIIVNCRDLYQKYEFSRNFEIDTEIIVDLFSYYLKQNDCLSTIVEKVLSNIKGTASCIVHLKDKGKVILFTNNGSLYYAKKNESIFISSEYFPLSAIKCSNIQQVKKVIIFDVPLSNQNIVIKDHKIERQNLVPVISKSLVEEKLLDFKYNPLKRCNKCILPENFPFIKFDKSGICNFCNNYKKKYQNFNKENSKNEISKIIEKYKRGKTIPCLFPLSGGRDSCYGLHLMIEELNIRPLTFTYDWGLVTDLARRNISRMCSELKIENIIFADNIRLKRNNIKKNIVAWLKKPHLGMVNLFNAGDKHFYRFLNIIKTQNNIDLNIWSYGPYEITHFKHGFLGIEPNFNNNKTYDAGLSKQLNYHFKRLKVMMSNLSYFNSSILDTLVGEYSRSIKKHYDYYYLFNYFKWNENEINKTLIGKYDWETSTDTKSTWRIGDGAASFYNYIYYTLAGFTEFDTFRSNQIREGDIKRDEAISFVNEENKPRYESLKWFLNIIGLDFETTIKRINEFNFVNSKNFELK